MIRLTRALDKREYLMIIFLTSHGNHVVTPHVNCRVYRSNLYFFTTANRGYFDNLGLISSRKDLECTFHV